MDNKKLFKKVRTYVNSKGVKVTEYEPTRDIYIDSIDPFTGTVSKQKILMASKHEGITMYRVQDTKNRFKSFLVSDDHSLIVYDSYDDKITLVTPKQLKENPERYYLIQKKN